MARSRWQVELEKVRQNRGGTLKPKDVVEAARDPKSALHSKFEWDNGKAAAAYRLQQAAELIRVVMVNSISGGEPVRAYVSLSSDRLGKTGYRAMADVVSDKEMMAVLVADALQELQAFKIRYDAIRKIARMRPVFLAIDRME